MLLGNWLFLKEIGFRSELKGWGKGRTGPPSWVTQSEPLLPVKKIKISGYPIIRLSFPPIHWKDNPDSCYEEITTLEQLGRRTRSSSL
jgi:hypothetical protein